MFIGRAKNIKAGFTKALTKTIIIAAIKAPKKLETFIPGTIKPIKRSAKDKAINLRIIVHMIISFLKTTFQY